MAREIIAVFQDCVLCGVKGRKKIAEYAAKGFNIRKVGFTTDEGRELCYQAVQKGIGQMPFYVSEGQFSTNIQTFTSDNTPKAPKPSKSAKKSPKKATRERKTKITDRSKENGTTGQD